MSGGFSTMNKSDFKEKSLKEKRKDWRVIEFCAPIKEFIGDDNKDFMIRGIAINETTTRNGVTYIAEELQKAAPSFRDKPILKDHDAKIENIVGRTTENVVWNDMNKSIDFEARIVDEKIKGMIKSGLVKNVSIGAKVADIVEDKDSGTLTAIGMEGLELSLVAVPGDPGAGIANAMRESFDMKHSVIKFKQEVNQMSNEKIKNNEENTGDKEETKEESKVKPVAEEKIQNIEVKNSIDMSSLSSTLEEFKKGLLEDVKAIVTKESDKEKKVVEDDTEDDDETSADEPMEDETKGQVGTDVPAEEDTEESMCVESAETGKGFAIYRDYSKDSTGNLKRLIRA